MGLGARSAVLLLHGAPSLLVVLDIPDHLRPGSDNKENHSPTAAAAALIIPSLTMAGLMM